MTGYRVQTFDRTGMLMNIIEAPTARQIFEQARLESRHYRSVSIVTRVINDVDTVLSAVDWSDSRNEHTKIHDLRDCAFLFSQVYDAYFSPEDEHYMFSRRKR